MRSRLYRGVVRHTRSDAIKNRFRYGIYYVYLDLDELEEVGASTALFAATVGCVQNDIKRVIAYSTCSQLGYMFFAAGVSAYPAAIFHLFTHAFFKALLFLGAGSVIHAMGDEQDIRRMGGIWRKVPITYAVMWIGSLALAGVPFFAGFAANLCVLNRDYGMRAFHGRGYGTVLVRDGTVAIEAASTVDRGVLLEAAVVEAEMNFSGSIASGELRVALQGSAGVA